MSIFTTRWWTIRDICLFNKPIIVGYRSGPQLYERMKSMVISDQVKVTD